MLRRSTVVCALLLSAALPALAAPAYFQTDLDQAKQQASETGKLIFAYFSMDG